MPFERYDEAHLRDRLQRLPKTKRVVFALRCAERLFPAYEEFARANSSADAVTMRQGLEALRESVAGNPRDRHDIERLSDRCLELVPDEDDLPSYLSGHAQNAASAIVYALRALLTARVQDAAWAALQGYEAADLTAARDLDIDLNSPGAEQMLLEHPAVQRELASQEQVLVELEADN